VKNFLSIKEGMEIFSTKLKVCGRSIELRKLNNVIFKVLVLLLVFTLLMSLPPKRNAKVLGIEIVELPNDPKFENNNIIKMPK